MKLYEKYLGEKSFASGKDAKDIVMYLEKMANHWLTSIKSAKQTGSYGTIANTLVDSGINDLTKIKKQLDRMSKTGKISER